MREHSKEMSGLPPTGMHGRPRLLRWGAASIAAAILVAGFMAAPAAHAALTYSGNIFPATNPTTWTNNSTGTTAYIGYQTGDGSVAIDGGSAVKAKMAYLGYAAGLTGTVSVTGTNSSFNPRSLFVGYSGTGNISIAGGAYVQTNASPGAYLGYNAGSSGTVTVDGAGSAFYNSYPLYVGFSGSGNISVTNGGTLTSTPGYVGYNTGSSGTVTIDGTGSKWTNSGSLAIGGSGTGTLNITNGSSVSATGTTTVGAHGAVNFGTNGGTLTTGSLYAGMQQFSGTGTITTTGIVGDMDIVFDGSHGTSQSFAANGVTVNLNLSSTGALGVGYLGSGALGISGGVNIASKTGYLGYGAGSTGTATVTGAGSTWSNSGTLYVGNSGTGNLFITNGGSVTSYGGYVGYNTGSNGTVTVDGAGSSLKSILNGALAGNLDIGSNGTGTLNITNGSTVTAMGVTKVGALGTVNFGSSGGTLNTGMLSAGASQFSGTGTVITHGWLGDLNLAYNAPGATPLTLATWAGANKNVTVNLDLSGSGGITGDLAVGYQNSGSLAFNNGATATTKNAYIGYSAGSTGSATVTGPGSTWTLAGDTGINVGNYGSGSLSVTNGGVVSGSGGIHVGYYMGSTGTVTVDGAGSQLNTGLSVGQFGTGVARIVNGGSVHSQSVTVGASGSISGWTPTGPGILLVDGSGSTIAFNSSLYVGHSGEGRLMITNGAHVFGTQSGTYNSYIAIADMPSPYTSGVVVVDGAGSKLATGDGASGSLTLGANNNGVGKLSISDGGSVYAGSVYIDTNSILTADVGSSLKVGSTGTGSISRSNAGGGSGTIRVVAGANAAAGAYTPISVGTIESTIKVQALGGIWDSTNHTITVSAAALAADGEAKTIDLATTQRYLFANSQTGKSVGAAFQGTATSTPLTLTAASMSGAQLSSLQALLDPGKSVLSGWSFTADGYTAGNPVYLSLWAGNATSLADLTVWHFDGADWTKFDATDLAYDKTYASFTVTGFSGYAVSGNAPVPLPPAFYMFGSGLIGLLGARRRFFKG